MTFADQPFIDDAAPEPVSDLYLADEQALVGSLCEMADSGKRARSRIGKTAAALVESVRRNSSNEGGIEAFLQQYNLSSEEGILLMCVAEALLRIPDSSTADRLIADKITSANWKEHIGESDSLFVNASTWGLMLTGQILNLDSIAKGNPTRYLGKLVSRAGEPFVRTAMRQAMKIMGHQFVTGRTIEEALARSRKGSNRDYRYSFDMLGEAALTTSDAERYFESYSDAIGKIGSSVSGQTDLVAAPSISVKLSALHPRYNYSQFTRVHKELVPVVTELALQAEKAGIALTMDAEEADRLEISLQVFEAVYKDKRLKNFSGLGLAVQAYQRRATDVVKYISSMADSAGRCIPVRLVKGAYWDTEIKLGQMLGLNSYPVFTRKAHTDVSYLACARVLLDSSHVYAQFATHNAHTLASIMHFSGTKKEFEFQRLHGMGEELYSEVIDPDKFGHPCRVYGPVGSHEDLLPYLVRRLLENGANTSFVNRIVDESIAVADIVADPITVTRKTECKPHPSIFAPAELFGDERRNSAGFNFADQKALRTLMRSMQKSAGRVAIASPIVGGTALTGVELAILNPADTSEVVGSCVQATREAVDQALDLSVSAQVQWNRTGAHERSKILQEAARLFEENAPELLALCVREAGKTVPDAESELREAIDFLRYYASEAEKHYGNVILLPGPTGERNTLSLRGKGVFVCISPWNFPLAIFTGQVAAALAAGNAVLAKPAEQTPLVAHRAVQLLLEAGVPSEVLHFLPGDGAEIGGYAVADTRVAGVAFTGSTETAKLINRALANRDGSIATLIAETGGQNAMFVDSSALPEQVVLDAVYSAFNSAGQRCSALRVLCLQEDIADRVIELLKGHMDELSIGDPSLLSTDVGPVIDEDAKRLLLNHVASISKESRIVHQCQLDETTDAGTFVAPTAIEIDELGQLDKEVFGPVLHILRFNGNRLAEMVDAVNDTGFGLTMGLHSRIDRRAEALALHSGAGNLYINRNMIGATVGVQPFGGRGLSGTGPKAGGPHYLPRFGNEFSVSNNLSAVGGNATLLSLEED